MATKKTVTSKRLEVKKKTEIPRSELGRAIPILLYRRIALTFVILVTVSLIVVLYLSTMQAVIRVQAVSEEVEADFFVRTTEIATSDSEVQGEVQSGTLEKTKIFTPTGTSQTEVEYQAVGEVTITNEMSSAQPLVATTRLLSPDGMLFRLKKGVTVPAKGSVKAEVYADQKGASGNIAPTTFTIPGLSPAKQKLVYAKSDVAFIGGVQYKSVLSQEEIDQAVESLKAEILEDAKSILRSETEKTYDGETFFVDIIKKEINAKAGDEVGVFNVTLSVEISGVFYDNTALTKIIEKKLYEGIEQGKEFVDLGASERKIIVEQVNVKQGIVRLHVIQVGRAIPSRVNQAFHVGRFVGMSESEVRELLVKEGLAENVKVQFFPFWVRTIPQLKDHVYIEIQ
ncbi:hypothetical protein HY771_00680 [Candidatus Uhrbacteria bacterium]|nr:hypothetical protein [Candidatus Uhrbacteria bacterium]